MNPAATRISGYSVEELTAMRDFPGALVYEPDRERIVRAFESALKGGSGTEQFRLKHKDGRTLWAEMTWQPIYDEKGNPLGHRESIRDVTARRLAEQAAEVAEWEEEAILDSMAEQIVHLDADGSILWANQAACESAGMGREEVVGRFWYEMPLEWHALDSCPALEAMEAGRRIEAKKSTDTGRTWLVQAAPLRDPSGAIMGGVEVSLDVTEYKPAPEQAAQELPQEKRELEIPAEVRDPPPDLPPSS